MKNLKHAAANNTPNSAIPYTFYNVEKRAEEAGVQKNSVKLLALENFKIISEKINCLKFKLIFRLYTISCVQTCMHSLCAGLPYTHFLGVIRSCLTQ